MKKGEKWAEEMAIIKQNELNINFYLFICLCFLAYAQIGFHLQCAVLKDKCSNLVILDSTGFREQDIERT